METTGKYSSLLARMQRLCSVREYCRSDIEKKLIKEELTFEQIEQIIAGLVKEKYIDEERYAGAFAKDKSKLAGWGPGKIIFALKSKKIPGDIITEAVFKIENDEAEDRLKKMLQQKLRSINKEKDKDKLLAKLLRFGTGRGFEYGKVYRISKALITNDND